MALEREVLGSLTRAAHGIAQRLDDIEKAVNDLKVPVSFAGQFYVLRQHIIFVRGAAYGRRGRGLTLRAAVSHSHQANYRLLMPIQWLECGVLTAANLPPHAACRSTALLSGERRIAAQRHFRHLGG